MTLISKKTHCGACGSSTIRKTLKDKRSSCIYAVEICGSDICERAVATMIECGGQKDSPDLFKAGLLGNTFITTKSAIKGTLEEKNR